MLIGVPKEIKDQEYRVGLLPSSTRELTHHGHQVIVETMAGHAIGMDDEDYAAAGAEVVGSAADVFARAELIVKVKEPLAPEIAGSISTTTPISARLQPASWTIPAGTASSSTRTTATRISGWDTSRPMFPAIGN